MALAAQQRCYYSNGLSQTSSTGQARNDNSTRPHQSMSSTLSMKHPLFRANPTSSLAAAPSIDTAFADLSTSCDLNDNVLQNGAYEKKRHLKSSLCQNENNVESKISSGYESQFNNYSDNFNSTSNRQNKNLHNNFNNGGGVDSAGPSSASSSCSSLLAANQLGGSNHVDNGNLPGSMTNNNSSSGCSSASPVGCISSMASNQPDKPIGYGAFGVVW